MDLAARAPPARPRLSFESSAVSQETICPTATPPISIPVPIENSTITESDETTSTAIDRYMRNRETSISFDDEIKLDSGLRQSIQEPLQKTPSREDRRGRPFLIPTESKANRAHSESERSHYDQITGRHLPKYSTSPPREHPRIGEARFPLLQRTVDEMARESTTDLGQSPNIPPPEEVVTPRYDDDYALSPTIASPSEGQAFSYDESRPFRRTASQRWRDGEFSASPQDFFSRAGSLRKSMHDIASRASRQNTSGSTRSPRSAASSYLRAFSVSSGTNGDGLDSISASVDGEGQTIGDDYVLGKRIGFGGFSTIKEVTQLQDGKHRKLAVKIVRRRLEGKSEVENEQAQAEFEHEVELWRFLNHPNILPLEAVYKLDEATFCFIPLNGGGTLFDLVRSNRKGVPLEIAKSYSYQLAMGLRYLHLDARVVHRDIKLENVLIEPSQDGQPGLLRICDFGMAEWISSDNSSGPPSPSVHDSDRPPQKHIGPADTSTSAFTGGSLEYAAPEILRIAECLDSCEPAERAIVSPAVDIWAYGVCVYSMVVGSRPFNDAFQPRVTMKILAGEWDRQKLADKGGDDVLELVSNCLAMEDSSRWDISRVLDSRWLEDLAVKEESPQPNTTVWRL
ncbi:CAMK protein kinase [Exophiala aquamarina CBS 119918]|uniref:CAMK protein kinase n=1 Tax=Exophiala aquamarina CBS 119918 TaxID=1182545 RepID=A0A072NYW1_9EURO|nr:CAMK protein kinase [Exophiala aquamarina CBS 119918]KEF53069.1 CAMK protein kinase [Exophiala aquamarina CBS 119918]